MPKTQIQLAEVSPSFFSTVQPGTYTYPTSIVLDTSGRIISITSSSAYSAGAINTVTGVINQISVNTSSGTVIASLTPIQTLATYTNFSGLSVDTYGRVTAVSTFTMATIIPGSYTAITSITSDVNGRITSIESTGSVTVSYLNLVSLNLPSIIYTQTQIERAYNWGYLNGSVNYVGSGTICDLSQNSIFGGNNAPPTGWYMSLTNVSSVTNTIQTAIGVWTSGGAPTGIGGINTSTISINGSMVPIKWTNGIAPNGPNVPAFPTIYIWIYTFYIRYDGTSYYVYGNMNFY